MTQLYFHWTNLKGKKSYSIRRMVHYKNWKRQTKCYYDHKQIHKISDNPWKNRRKITRPWPYHTFISRHSNPICSFLWPLKVIKVRTFWEAQIIWKKSSLLFWRLLSKSADLSKPWGRFFQILCVSQKVRALLKKN